MSIFQEIYQASKNKIEKKLALPLTKQFELTNPNDLQSLISLAYYQYVVGNVDASFELASLISEIKFDNDFEIWGPVEDGLVLLSAIYKERIDKKSAEVCINKINVRLEEGSPVNKKVFTRKLNGDGLSNAYKKIEQAFDKEAEYSRRMGLLKKLMWIRELGGGPDFTVERADKEMQDNIEKLKTLIEAEQA